MNEKEAFFEISTLEVCGDLKANFVMVEDDGKGPAYLGWCENLAIDTPETLPGGRCLFCVFASRRVVELSMSWTVFSVTATRYRDTSCVSILYSLPMWCDTCLSM